ncbi:MAG: hypothetical protein WC564_05180 [Patescibacteria group bacterium]|jgi:hypothetical protein
MSHSNEYRNEVRKIGKDVPFTFWTFFKWSLGFIIVVAVLGFVAQSLGIISLSIEREKIQHSQPYIETKVVLLEKLHNDWYDLEAEIVELKLAKESDEFISAKQAQQKNIVKRIKAEANLIPESQIPEEINDFILTHKNN